MSESPKPTISPTWPVVVALGLVGLLIAGMVVLDVRLGRSVSADTYQIVENSQRSIELIDAIRARAEDLARGVTATERASLVTEIAALGRDYAPLTTSTGEVAEWDILQTLVRQLSEAPLDDTATHQRLARQVDASADRLVAINAEEGRANAKRIREAHDDAIRDDIVTGVVTLLIVAAIGIALIRLLARQRRLVLAQVQILADKNRDLEAFAGRAAHDLRSPMNPIRGYADLLLESTESPEQVAMMARRIRTSVDRMARVVDDMLALSTAGRPPPGASSIDDVVAAVIEELGPDLHGVDVKTDLVPSRVACSAGILNQLLRNLIGNAVKYRDRTRPLSIAIETRESGPMVEIAVQDNGIGMDPETATHAFEPHYRGRMDRELPGHGLGLAIVERTTRALGGTCTLSSVIDRGTRIVVELPRAT